MDKWIEQLKQAGPREIIIMACYIAAGAIAVAVATYWMIYPHMTGMELFLAFWPFQWIAIGLGALGRLLDA